MSAASAAEPLLDVTEQLQRSDAVMRTTPDIPAVEFAELLRAGLEAFFTRDRVEVVVDASMSAKAAAGSKRVKVQAGAYVLDRSTSPSCSTTRPSSTPPPASAGSTSHISR